MYTGPFPIQCYVPELYTYTTWAFLKHSLEILTQLFCWKKHPMVSTAYHLCVLHMKKVFATYEALYLHARLCVYLRLIAKHISIRKKTQWMNMPTNARQLSPLLLRKVHQYTFLIIWAWGHMRCSLSKSENHARCKTWCRIPYVLLSICILRFNHMLCFLPFSPAYTTHSIEIN